MDGKNSIITSSGSANYYSDAAYNIQLSNHTTDGNFIQISSPSGASLALYYKIIGQKKFIL